MKTEPDYTGASQDLETIIKQEFRGNNKVYFLISERGFQRIEIKDEDNGEIWQTLEAVEPVDDKHNFDEISANLISALHQQLK